MAGRRQLHALSLYTPSAPPGPSPCGRVAWCLAGVLVVATQGFVVEADRILTRLYGADGHWFVATYAEPWRTAVIALSVLLSLAIALSAAFASRPIHTVRPFSTALAMIAGLAICVELTTAVRFNDALGRLYVHTLAYRRAAISFHKNGTHWCLRADFRNPLAWRLNGTSIHPRLLPLPYESSVLAHRLSSLSKHCEKDHTR